MSPPTLILVRHAQAEHNQEDKSPLKAQTGQEGIAHVINRFQIPDPKLTDLGRTQCPGLQEHLKALLAREGLDVELIVVSPFKRTVETALLSLGFLIDTGVPVRANADWQETSDAPCDIGSPLAELTSLFPQVDFSFVDPVYPDKVSPAGKRYAANSVAVVARAQAALADLYRHGSATTTDVTTPGTDKEKREKKKPAVVVVSHAGFLSNGVTGLQFMNADYRIFDIVKRGEGEGEGEGQAKGAQQQRTYSLQEWSISKGEGARGLSYDNPVEIGANEPS